MKPKTNRKILISVLVCIVSIVVLCLLPTGFEIRESGFKIIAILVGFCRKNML